jgi:hypothetical protein
MFCVNYPESVLLGFFVSPLHCVHHCHNNGFVHWTVQSMSWESCHDLASMKSSILTHQVQELVLGTVGYLARVEKQSVAMEGIP